MLNTITPHPPHPSAAPQNMGPIVLVGGQGKMGQLFARFFMAAGFTIKILEKHNWRQAPEVLHQARAVIVTVPISVACQVIAELPKLNAACILADFTSVKQAPLQAMLASHSGPVIGLHPMFGPSIENMHNHLLIYCEGRQTNDCQWLLQQLASWGLKLLPAQPAQHDKYMAFIQGLRHLLHFSLGSYMMQQELDPALLLNMASTSFHVDMMQVGRLFKQNPQLCADIIAQSQAVLEDYHHHLAALLAMLGNSEKLTEIFNNVDAWLGEHGARLNQQSNALEKYLRQT